MRKRYLAVLAGGLVLAWGGRVAEAAPKLEFDKLTYDFGKTSMVQTVTGTFTFRNTGDAPLEIQKPAPTCGCTVAELKPSKLAPGEKGELTFSLNVGNVRGRSQKFINVPSNDPATPNTRLTIAVEVQQIYEVTPQYLGLGMLSLGTVTNLAVEVKRTDGQALKITRVQSAQPYLTGQAEPKADAPSAATIALVLKAETPPRRFADSVQVFTADSGDQPAFVVQVMGQIVGEVAIQPERLVWGIGQVERLPVQHLERALTRSVRIIKTSKDQDLDLKNVATTLKDMNVEIVTLEKGRSYMLVAKFAEPPKASESGTITVETNLASIPKLEVPVSVNVIQR